jgi:ABC-type lipoprotein export system ATPase subunit
MANADAQVLVSVEVAGLFGQFDHTIKFDPDDEFVIIHGPNGIGKTKLLELINNVYAVNLDELAAMPFDMARFSFADSSLLTISHEQQLTLAPDDEDDVVKMAFVLRVPSGEESIWNINTSAEPSSGAASMIDRRLRSVDPDLRRVGPRRWQDISNGEILTLEDIQLRYAAFLPAQLRHLSLRPEPQPDAIRTFLNGLHSHLIETQRLIVPRRRPRSRVDESEPQHATVLEFSEDLKRRFGTALADNARTSQQLDKQFPGRLLNISAPPFDATEENIRDRYTEQGQIRKKLAEISLLDTSYELPLPERRLDDWHRIVLWTYLDDTDKKLATFLPILARVDLMREIVNAKFLDKQLVIDREKGFRFRSNNGKELSPEQLSSGEQHELVLVYDLLFNTQSNSLVLIDEPEISLHASWQQEFLSDIVRISNVASLRFIIATHSPQIIHEWWSRTVTLTPRSS